MDLSLAVLIVEDSVDLAALLEAALDDAGHQVRTVGDGGSALAALAEKWPDVLLLDRMLPDMDGLELCGHVRMQRADEPFLPVLVLSGLDSIQEKAHAFASGADDYVTKPFELDELQARVRVWGRVGQRIRERDKLRRLYDESQRNALTDPLTGLYNRRALEELLIQELAKARRLKYPVGLLVIDVDYFKTINDHLGHLEGDRVLQAIAHAVRQALRQSDLAARFGGDEFVALLPGCQPDALEAVAEQVRAAVAELQPTEALVHGVTVSIGAAMAKGPDLEAQALLAAADAALYRAKAAGRNRVALLDPGTACMEHIRRTSAPLPARARAATDGERRADPLLRDVVYRCQPYLEARGFFLGGRGSSDERGWVEFSRPERDAEGQEGVLWLVFEHGRERRSLAVDAYFVDAALEHTPRHKLLCRYDDRPAPAIVHGLVSAIQDWPE